MKDLEPCFDFIETGLQPASITRPYHPALAGAAAGLGSGLSCLFDQEM
jgi:hypothetical protein